MFLWLVIAYDRVRVCECLPSALKQSKGTVRGGMKDRERLGNALELEHLCGASEKRSFPWF